MKNLIVTLSLLLAFMVPSGLLSASEYGSSREVASTSHKHKKKAKKKAKKAHKQAKAKKKASKTHAPSHAKPEPKEDFTAPPVGGDDLPPPGQADPK